METQHVYCLSCVSDLTLMPKERRNLGPDSKAAAEPRQRVLFSWIAGGEAKNEATKCTTCMASINV